MKINCWLICMVFFSISTPNLYWYIFGVNELQKKINIFWCHFKHSWKKVLFETVKSFHIVYNLQDFAEFLILKLENHPHPFIFTQTLQIWPWRGKTPSQMFNGAFQKKNAILLWKFSKIFMKRKITFFGLKRAKKNCKN